MIYCPYHGVCRSGDDGRRVVAFSAKPLRDADYFKLTLELRDESLLERFPDKTRPSGSVNLIYLVCKRLFGWGKDG